MSEWERDALLADHAQSLRIKRLHYDSATDHQRLRVGRRARHAS
ncbi:hypothetical protein [Citreimonas salinaria]|nr:hypothetical protein [Citreimonas salinaria]